MKYDPKNPDFSLIPEGMKNVLRWVCWTADKTPINVKKACGADVKDPTTWTTFDAACNFIGKQATYVNKNKQQTTQEVIGIGFVLGDGWAGIDVDGGAEHGCGAVPVDVLDDFKQLNTYAEFSKSGEGYHFIGRYHGDKLEGAKNDCVEIYTGGRYFAITGNVYNGLASLGDITDALPQLHDKYIAAPKRAKEAQRAKAASSVVIHPGDNVWNDFMHKNIGSVLNYFDAADMDDWQFIGICMKSIGCTVDDFDVFSQKANYGGRKQIERFWAYWTQPDPDAGSKLYNKAKQRGWQHPEFPDAVKAWLREHYPKQNAPTKQPTAVAHAQEVPQGDVFDQQSTQADDASSVVIYEADPTVSEKAKKPRIVLPTDDNADPDGAMNYIDKQLIPDIQTFVGYKDRKTGFANLDKACGGLYPGLYVLGAISSLGKTTFAHAIGDNLAKANDHVLFFSLEQSRMEMALKSLARTSAQRDPAFFKVASAIELRRGEKRDILVKAAQDYTAAVGNRMHVIQCNFGVTADDIEKYTEAFMKTHPGIKPVVIVDYLQIIQQDDSSRMQEREKIDRSVRMLKKLQSDNDLVMIVISSVNRSNYLMPIDFESFKESGGIEYTADVVWGLQLQVVSHDDKFDTDNKTKAKRDMIREAKQQIPRKIELVCLKNRYGTSSYYAGFKYYPQYDYFEVMTDYEPPTKKN